MTTDAHPSAAEPARATGKARRAAASKPLASLARAFRRAWRLPVLVVHIVFGCVVAGTSVVRRRLGRLELYPYPRGCRWWMARCCRLLRVRVRAVGEPAPEPVLLVANHVSWLDIPVVGGLVDTSFVSKAEVRNWPVVGWMAAGGGTAFIPRGAHQASAVAGAIGTRLAEGGSAVLVFPEGTTTDGSYLRPFYPRLFACVQVPEVQGSGVVIQPVAIRYLHPSGVHPTAPFIDDETFPSHLWRVLGEREMEVEVRFCQPFPAAGLDRKGLALAARRAILEALGLS